MGPERKIQIGKYKIEEFYWNGRFVVYVNNHKVDMTYEQAVDYYSQLVGMEGLKTGWL